MKYDTFNDGYFPTRGVRLTLDGRYVFKGYTIDLDPKEIASMGYEAHTQDGRVPGYLSALASAQFAISIGNSFTIIPSIYLAWYSMRPEDTSEDNTLNTMHIPTIGEFIHIKPVYAFGAEYDRQSMFGPLKVAVQWCDLTGVTAYASIGFDL